MTAVRCPTPNCGKKLANALDGQMWTTCPRCKQDIHINTRGVAKVKPIMVG